MNALGLLNHTSSVAETGPEDWLAREIDSAEPDRPFIRERRLLNASEDDYVLGSPTLQPGRPPVRTHHS
jgi:hypothetical protein